MPNRRDFLAAAAGFAATAPFVRRAMAAPTTTLLFQGDSITDAGRDRAVNNRMRHAPSAPAIRAPRRSVPRTLPDRANSRSSTAA